MFMITMLATIQQQYNNIIHCIITLYSKVIYCMILYVVLKAKYAPVVACFVYSTVQYSIPVKKNILVCMVLYPNIQSGSLCWL